MSSIEAGLSGADFPMSKFVVIRKDLNLDAVEIESEGLTIGRLIGNDLALNHPTVSRTHAGIKEVRGDYWIFNLSEANGTLLNGEQIDQTPVADGDLIQIGPFFLYPRYISGGKGGIRIDVEMTVKPLPVEATTGQPTGQPTQPGISAEEGRTVRLDPGDLAKHQRQKSTPGGTRRLSGTGMLTGMLVPNEAQALKVFWDKRKREAGKLFSESPLMPRTRPRLGKAQFNWSPTRDLERPWPTALFVWGGLIVGILSLLALLFFKDAYSPGALSVAHARSDFSIQPVIARNVNSGSCTTCHSIRASMDRNCASCHTTDSFHSRISEKHLKVGLSCSSCHSEHQGRSFRPGLVANLACTGCHQDGSGYVSPLTGKPLNTPHGGTFGYPVKDGRWVWGNVSQVEWERRGLPGSTSQFNAREQFHLVHVAGRGQGRSNCTDCHVAGFAGDSLTRGIRESCANCHGTSATQAASLASNARLADDQIRMRLGAAPLNGALCVTCHSQHGEEKELRASLRRMER